MSMKQSYLLALLSLSNLFGMQSFKKEIHKNTLSLVKLQKPTSQWYTTQKNSSEEKLFHSNRKKYYSGWWGYGIWSYDSKYIYIDTLTIRPFRILAAVIVGTVLFNMTIDNLSFYDAIEPTDPYKNKQWKIRHEK